MMKYRHRFNQVILCIVVSITVLISVLVAPERAAATTPTPTPAPPNWSGDLVVAANIPFLWLRTQPASNANVIETIYASNVFTAVGSPSDLRFDGVQWWGQIRTSSATGWVEVA